MQITATSRQHARAHLSFCQSCQPCNIPWIFLHPRSPKSEFKIPKTQEGCKAWLRAVRLRGLLERGSVQVREIKGRPKELVFLVHTGVDVRDLQA